MAATLTKDLESHLPCTSATGRNNHECRKKTNSRSSSGREDLEAIRENWICQFPETRVDSAWVWMPHVNQYGFILANMDEDLKTEISRATLSRRPLFFGAPRKTKHLTRSRSIVVRARRIMSRSRPATTGTRADPKARRKALNELTKATELLRQAETEVEAVILGTKRVQ